MEYGVTPDGGRSKDDATAKPKTTKTFKTYAHSNKI